MTAPTCCTQDCRQGRDCPLRTNPIKQPTKPCQHAKTCPRRMRDGDRPGGCSAVDQSTCTPSLEPSRTTSMLHDRIAERYLFTMFKPRKDTENNP